MLDLELDMEKRNYPRKEYHQLFSRDIGPGDRFCECLPYRTIELERNPCFGRCPVYKLTLHHYGKAHWIGAANVERLGTYSGEFMINDFGKLCYFIDTSKIEELRNKYRAHGTDRSSTIVRLTRADGTNKTIEDYGNAGPIELWSLQQIIDSVGSHVQWRSTETRVDKQTGNE